MVSGTAIERLRQVSAHALQLSNELDLLLERALHPRALQFGIDPISLAKLMLEQGRNLAAALPGNLLADPARYMILALYIDEAEKRRSSITAACASSQAPPTTALRYIDRLVDHGIVEYERDEADKRRRYVRLTPEGRRIVADYLAHEAANISAI